VDHESPHRMPYEAHEDLDPVGAKENEHQSFRLTTFGTGNVVSDFCTS
jgi:hypothetical protein